MRSTKQIWSEVIQHDPTSPGAAVKLALEVVFWNRVMFPVFLIPTALWIGLTVGLWIW